VIPACRVFHFGYTFSQRRDSTAMHPSCFERWSDQLMRSPISKLPISYRRPTSHVFPDPRLSLPVWFCRLYPITRWREESRRGHRSLLWQAFTAYGLSVHHVYPSVLVSVSPTPGPEANVCPDLIRHSQRRVMLILSFFSVPPVRSGR
jgi:hypothetical protein